ncbi:urease accessory protein UreF [Xylanibacillus composti]|uniref:Urease accessory protein UreF n=1 Tax=Xylanibacillus composti TaxID=1572762 RepID=A0A8J4H2X5_9BACL|nr:urease accessory protein UreF [Xylanibacillus composti]MDT9723433.1 urease accessory protein UreF [Xylanibacillus composti]GIQ68531.1 urease accessory protein UreF [Xylanibacillus composti]
MNRDARFLAYVQMLDSALPIGGFSHSFGLETYVQKGAIGSLAELEQYMNSQIHCSLVRLEGLAIKGMYAAIEEADMRRFCRLDSILHVQRPASESREGQHKMGRRLLTLARKLYPWMALDELEQALSDYQAYGTLPAVHAWIACRLGIPMDDAVRGFLYTAVSAIAGSALRLMSVGQTECQLLISRGTEHIAEEWSKVRELPPDLLHSFSPLQDICAMQHEGLYSRLFMS